MQAIRLAPWLETRELAGRAVAGSLLSELDAGEAEAIALPLETKAGMLLLDERRARRMAFHLGLSVSGLLGVLTEAKHKRFVEGVRPILDDLIAKAGFWVSKSLYGRVLREAGE